MVLKCLYEHGMHIDVVVFVVVWTQSYPINQKMDFFEFIKTCTLYSQTYVQNLFFNSTKSYFGQSVVMNNIFKLLYCSFNHRAFDLFFVPNKKIEVRDATYLITIKGTYYKKRTLEIVLGVEVGQRLNGMRVFRSLPSHQPLSGLVLTNCVTEFTSECLLVLFEARY